MDCGRVVNPNGVRAQVESAAIYALTATLKDAITVERGRIVQSNFNDYQMMRMKEAPPIEVHLVASEEQPTGIGEPTVPVIAPALCNAIFDATRKSKKDVRIRRLPIRAEDGRFDRDTKPRETRRPTTRPRPLPRKPDSWCS